MNASLVDTDADATGVSLLQDRLWLEVLIRWALQLLLDLIAPVGHKLDVLGRELGAHLVLLLVSGDARSHGARVRHDLLDFLGIVLGVGLLLSQESPLLLVGDLRVIDVLRERVQSVTPACVETGSVQAQDRWDFLEHRRLGNLPGLVLVAHVLVILDVH